MNSLFTKRVSAIEKSKQELEQKLKIKITIKGGNVVYDGDSMDEYEASIVLDAVDFGFSVYQALQLLNANMIFKKIRIKDFTHRKNLKEVRARLIGTEGKTKRVFETVSGCNVLISDQEVGIIGDVASVEHVSTAVISLIQGSKQSNMYLYLEKMNKTKNDSTLI